jgi:peptidoglycan/xylan/chitin deacetylase (PgdA/CDA1 family)
MSQCIILNYHSITGNDNREEDPVYSVCRADFTEQLQMIRTSGVRILTLPELFKTHEEDKNCVCLTFDDGFPSDYAVVSPLLHQYGMKASFFVTLKNVPAGSPRWTEYKQLALEGNYIGAHGMSHAYLTDLDPDRQLYEIQESGRIVSLNTGLSSDFFALPGGKYNADTLEIAGSLHLKALLTTDFGVCSREDVPFLLKRCTIRKNYSKDKFMGLLHFDQTRIRREISISKIKKAGLAFLGNKLSDRINYLMKR